MATLADTIERFLHIEGAATGCGPRHPECQEKSVESRVRSFLGKYPLLRQDECYRDFLEIYAGAAIERDEDESDLVSILGFTEVSPDLEYFEGPAVSDDGFLVFAICVYYRRVEGRLYMYEYDFAFDMSGARKPGIYKGVSADDLKLSEFTWYADDFCSWLDDLIEKGGVYERPK